MQLFFDNSDAFDYRSFWIDFGIGNCDYPYFYFNQMYTVKEIVAKSIILLVVESVFVVGISSLLFTCSLNNGFIVAVNLILYALFFVLGNVTGYSRFFVYIPFYILICEPDYS